MASFNSFEEMEVWQRSRRFSKEIFRLTKIGPFARDFRLKDQINAASGSIMDNIAEGFERGGNREFIQALSVSKGSAGECRSQLARAFDREYITKEDFDRLNKEAIEISKMIRSLMAYLTKSEVRGPKFKDRT